MRRRFVVFTKQFLSEKHMRRSENVLGMYVVKF